MILYVLLSFLLIAQSGAMEQFIPEMLQIQDRLSEVTPLVINEGRKADIKRDKKESSLVTSSEDALDIIKPSDSSLQTLPDELFWQIIFQCEDAIIPLSHASRYLKKRIGELIPTIVLDRFPSSLDILKVLTVIEKCELKYGELAVKCVNPTYFPLYLSVVERLCATEPFIRFSPYFKWHQGSKRINAIQLIHGLRAPLSKLSAFEKFRRYCASMMRDPIVFGTAIMTTITLTSLMGWYIYEMNIPYQNGIQEALNYTYTSEYVESLIIYQGDTIGQLNLVPEGCFNQCVSDIQTCVNMSLVCKNNHLSLGAFNNSLWPYFEGLQKAYRDSCVFDSLSISVEDIKNALISPLEAMCVHADWAHNDFLQRVGVKKPLLMNPYITSWQCGDDPFKRNWPMGTISVDGYSYDPRCVAEYINEIPAGIPVWGAVGIVAQGVFWGLFLIGWCISF